MKSHQVATLREIGLLGGVHGPVAVSTKELGRRLGISQQSASKRILELLRLELVRRDLGLRGQRLQVTAKGMEALRREYAAYQSLFDVVGHLSVHGLVTAGLGEGAYYMKLQGYKDQFVRKLWFEPYEGTLNLKVPPQERSKLEVLREAAGIPIDGFVDGSRSYGGAKCFLTEVQGVECAAILPVRTHHADALEVISKHHLRSKLKLKDGDVVELRITL